MDISFRSLTIFYAFIFFAFSYNVSALQPPVEDYGLLPEYRSITISPDGKHYAYIRRIDKKDYFILHNTIENKMVGAFDAREYNARRVYFVTDNHVILLMGKRQRLVSYRGEWEHSGAIVYDIESKKLEPLLNRNDDIHPAQSGLGRIVGVNREKNLVYMPAYGGSFNNAPNNLYRVSLKNGNGVIHARGKSSTIDWFVSDQGKVLAREDYRKRDKEHQIYSKISGDWELIYSLKTDIPNISVQAVSADGKQLLFVDAEGDREAIYSLSLADGIVSGPKYQKENRDVDHLTQDNNRKLIAVKYSGLKPQYEFVNKDLDELYTRLENVFPMSDISFTSSTLSGEKILFHISGYEHADTYMLYDKSNDRIQKLASGYPNVESIGELKGIRYKARDGLKIPAIITLPTDPEKRENLPLLVLPHGGPESYSKISFNWLAQFFASKGYVVLQPNFRGSSGFGYAFRDAGRGKWGKEMQDDVSDGVLAMIEAGYADPSRVCIVGSSYGGYSALAGGAFSPELYRCVISIGGLSDLPRMLRDDKRKYGRQHWVISYWSKLVGESKAEEEKLRDISPVNFAKNFKAPVLLIHGSHDTVVPIKQSKMMHKALKKAGRKSELVILKGEDHWLSKSSTRLSMLEAIETFLDTYNPAD